MSVELHIPAAA